MALTLIQVSLDVTKETTQITKENIVKVIIV